MLLFSREHRVNWVGNTSPGARAGQEEAEGPCRAARAPRVLLEDAKCLLEQPLSSGVRTIKTIMKAVIKKLLKRLLEICRAHTSAAEVAIGAEKPGLC